MKLHASHSIFSIIHVTHLKNLLCKTNNLYITPIPKYKTHPFVFHLNTTRLISKLLTIKNPQLNTVQGYIHTAAIRITLIAKIQNQQIVKKELFFLPSTKSTMKRTSIYNLIILQYNMFKYKIKHNFNSNNL